MQTQEQAQQTVTMSINEMIFMQLRDLKESQREMNNRMDRIERRMDRLEEKIGDLDKKFDSKIDALRNEIKSSANHGQIATISSVGIGVSTVSITLGVLYALLFK